MTSPPIRVLICEDDPRVRDGLARGLGAAGLVVAGAVGTGEAAVAALTAEPPDVLLLDIELPGMSGLDVIAAVGGRVRADILVLTTFDDERKVYQAICGGAAGYLTKRSPIARIVEAIADVHAGGTVIDPGLARRFWNYFQSQTGHAAADPYDLTPEEREVLTLVGRGLTNPEVGRAIGRTRRAVKVDLERIYRKLGVSRRVDAVVKAVAAGLVEL
ncbi:MAG TPA: response regulator transcription factor [Polyangia bacterium]